jgi:hypothetical protein
MMLMMELMERKTKPPRQSAQAALLSIGSVFSYAAWETPSLVVGEECFRRQAGRVFISLPCLRG